MDATRIDIADAHPLAVAQHRMGIETPSRIPAMALESTWSAIHEAAATVGMIAGIDHARVNHAVELGLRTRFSRLGQSVRNDVNDLADIMQRGIAALLAAHTAGGAPQAAAQALWAEFLVARDTIISRLTPLASDRCA
jgi:hypothetical protein